MIFCTDNKQRHLLVNSETYANILKVRHELFAAIQHYFRSNEYVEVQIPVFTRSISSPGALNGKIPSDVSPFVVDYFNKEMFLSQSSQLYLESLIRIFPKVFTNMPSFRNEPSDQRHLNEFWHVEIEQSNTHLDQILGVQEKMLCFFIDWMLAYCEKEIFAFTGKQRIEELQQIRRPFPRITYSDALKRLETELDEPVNLEASCTDLGHFSSKHEIQITNFYPGQPVFVTNYPMNEVAFYHKMDPSNPEVVLNADLLAPGYGEIVGSGQRIDTQQELSEKFSRFEMKLEDYQWYLDLRKDQKDPNSGFGMGIERFITWLLKLPDIEHAIAFPRLTDTYLP